MQERLQAFFDGSVNIPIARSRIRHVEIVLSLAILAVLLWPQVESAGYTSILVELGYLVGFLSPPVLALVVLVGVLDDGLTVGGVLLGLIALLTLYVAFISLWVLLFPPEGGGVYGGHLFTLAAGILLAVGVLARIVVVQAFGLTVTKILH